MADEWAYMCIIHLSSLMVKFARLDPKVPGLALPQLGSNEGILKLNL